MDDDANFRGGRLRLTTFLRVVENGIPERPSRFKRRVPLLPVEQLPQTANQHVSGHTDPSSAPMPGEGGGLLESMLQPPVVETTIYDSNSAQDDASVDVATNVQPNPFMLAGSEYDIPCSPSSADPIMDSGDHSTKDGSSADDRRVVANATKFDCNRMATRKPKALGIKSKPQRPANARKRRLPVQSLALLRTSTADGLPCPSDAENMPAIPITEADPIDDSQLNLSLAIAKRAQGSIPSRPPSPLKNASSSIRQIGRLGGSWSGKLQISPSSTSRPVLVHKKSLHDQAVRTRFVAEGFEGDELNIPIASTRKPRRRAKLAPPELRPSPIVTGLVLASGVLPAPVTSYGSQSVSSDERSTDSTTTIGAMGDDASPAYLPDKADSANARHNSHEMHHQRSQKPDNESAIRGQLLSISAPVRRESESSDAVSSTEDYSIEEERESLDADTVDDLAIDYVSVPGIRRPTYTEDQRYFENAMYHLDIETSARSPEHDFWSQYNAMD